MQAHVPARPDPQTIVWIEREVLLLENGLSNAGAAEFAALDTIVPIVRETGNAALLGRALSLLSRAQIIQGEHEQAIRTAEAALEAFDGLDPLCAQHYSGPRSEAIRAAGNALLKLGHVARALPKIEDAVAVAQAALDSPLAPQGSGISALSALVRGLITLGAALFATREIDTAIVVYYRTIDVADAHPEAYDQCPDDVMIALWNLTDTLHERARNRRAADDTAGAQADLDAAQNVLEVAAERVFDRRHDDDRPAPRFGRALTPYGREGFFGSLARHVLLLGKPAEAIELFERQLVEISREGFVHKGVFAAAQSGLAQATLALGRPLDALKHSALALSALDEHDEATDRAAALLARSAAFRALDQNAQAYEALEQHYAVRSRLDASAANQYAALMTARLGLERARADAESHRQIAAMLATLGRVGQEITASLDPDHVCRILAEHLRALLACPGCLVWLVVDNGSALRLGYGVDDETVLAPAKIAIDDQHSATARVARERREIVGDAARSKMQTSLSAPLVVVGRLLGVVTIGSDRSGDFSANERSIFQTLCTYGAIALDNAAAYTKLERTVVALQATQTELAVRTAEFERLSMTDPLTGLGNRRHLIERAGIEIAERRRKSSPLAVAMFDIDHFKHVNDTHGHAAGDVVLHVVARVAKDWLRPGDFIARVGGEEFALLLPGAGKREALAIAERIRASIAETPIVCAEATVWVTSSFGVTCFDASIDTLDDALKRADAALYGAKESGRDRVHFGD